jgi:hypothetical protein
MMRIAAGLTGVGVVSALHEHQVNVSAAGGCVAPGICVEPSTTYKRVLTGPKPGQQWNINGGFCGAFSTQQNAMAHGAWISQDLVRKANRDGSGPHDMHGDSSEGYEVMPSNVAYTAQQLKLTYDEFDYTQAKPQANAYKKWLKGHLVQGHGVVWFPMCKGDGHDCYGGSPCPNGGHVDHIEPVYGIFSNHPLTDDTVYDDDWILHASDQDFQPYYRKMSTLEDSPDLQGNCREAQAGFGKNEMYPCIDEQVTYGLAVTGIAVEGALPVSLEIPDTSEPNVRNPFSRPSNLHGTVTVSGLQVGKEYVLYRFSGTDSLPSKAPFSGYEDMTTFTAQDSTWTFEDPKTFKSNSATYYVAVEADSVIV